MNKNADLLIAALSMVFVGSVVAAVPAEEAKKLGTTLTEFGAEKAGNAEGTIPAYDAANASPPAPSNYDPKNPGKRRDPYGDKPLFTVTAQNAAQHADKIDAMAALFKQYPDYRMPIYPTHRSAAYPKWYLDNTIKNATSCNSTKGDLVLEGCFGGVPFPIPTNGSQLMWNHLLSWEATYMLSRTRSWLVPPNGNAVFVGENTGRSYLAYGDPDVPGPRPSDLIYWKYRSVDQAPARIIGQQLVLLDPLDAVTVGRRAYQYIPGQRRVKLAPDLAYDTPSPYSGGSQNMDDAKGFLGAIDRFDWKLKGKKEKFIHYNNFGYVDPDFCPENKLMTPKFPNPDCSRWELHRVWIVEGTLKPGLRHVYKRRIHYWDEDTYGAGSVEAYDASNKLYRVNNVHSFPFYRSEIPGTVSGLNYVMDLRTGLYSMSGIGPCETCGWWQTKTIDKNAWSPEAMAGEGIR